MTHAHPPHHTPFPGALVDTPAGRRMRDALWEVAKGGVGLGTPGGLLSRSSCGEPRPREPVPARADARGPTDGLRGAPGWAQARPDGHWLQVHTHAHTYTLTCAHMHVCSCTRPHTDTCVPTRAHTYPHVPTLTCAHMYTLTHSSQTRSFCDLIAFPALFSFLTVYYSKIF